MIIAVMRCETCHYLRYVACVLAAQLETSGRFALYNEPPPKTADTEH